MARLHSNIGDMLQRMTPSDVATTEGAGEEPDAAPAAEAVTEPQVVETTPEPAPEAAPDPAVAEAEGEGQPKQTAVKAPRKPRASTSKKKKQSPEVAPEPDAEAEEEEVPAVTVPSTGYLSYERKETRLREDQYADLTLTSRRLNRAKGPGGERITENTLIRVAIDMLLAKKADLRGVDEAALRKSMGL